MSRLCVLGGVALATAGFMSADATLAMFGFVVGELGAVELTLRARRERHSRRSP